MTVDTNTTTTESTIDGVAVSAIVAVYPEFQTYVDKYVALATEESELRTKLNNKIGVRQEFETILKEYLDKYRFSTTTTNNKASNQ